MLQRAYAAAVLDAELARWIQTLTLHYNAVFQHALRRFEIHALNAASLHLRIHSLMFPSHWFM
jgi:hypothetical protein